MKTAVGGLLLREGEGSLKLNAAMLPVMPHRCNRIDMQILAPSMLALALFRWPSKEARKQGKILREPGAGYGLVIIEGRQFPFSLTGLWQSPEPPKVGMTVEAEFQDGKLVAIRPIAARSDGPSRSRPAS